MPRPPPWNGANFLPPASPSPKSDKSRPVLSDFEESAPNSFDPRHPQNQTKPAPSCPILRKASPLLNYPASPESDKNSPFPSDFEESTPQKTATPLPQNQTKSAPSCPILRKIPPSSCLAILKIRQNRPNFVRFRGKIPTRIPGIRQNNGPLVSQNGSQRAVLMSPVREEERKEVKKNLAKGHSLVSPGTQPCFFAAGAMDRLGSRSGIIMDCVAWYRSDLPGHTVPIGWLERSS